MTDQRHFSAKSHTAFKFFLLLFSMGLGLPSLSSAQVLHADDFRPGVLYSPGTVQPQPPSQDIDRFIEGLNHTDNLRFQNAVSFFFDKNTPGFYNWKMPDWVIYIHQDGTIVQRIIGDKMKRDKETDHLRLEGDTDNVLDVEQGRKMYQKRHLYVLVIADFPQFPDTQGNTLNSQINLSVSHETIGQFTSATEALIDNLTVGKTGVGSAAVTNNSNESVTLATTPVYDFSVFTAKAEMGAQLNFLTQLETALRRVQHLKTIAVHDPSRFDNLAYSKELTDLISELNPRSDLKPQAQWGLQLGNEIGSPQKFISNLNRLLSQLDKYRLIRLNDVMQTFQNAQDPGKPYLFNKNLTLAEVQQTVKEDVKSHHWFLYYGITSLDLSTDSINRCVVTLPGQVAAQFTDYHPTVVINTFGNTDKEIGGLSIALVNSNIGPTPSLTHPNPDLYLLGHLYLIPPEKPWSMESLSLCVGPEISLSVPFSSLVTAIDYGIPGNSNLGILVGCKWYSSENGFQPSWLYGINYFL